MWVGGVELTRDITWNENVGFFSFNEAGSLFSSLDILIRFNA